MNSTPAEIDALYDELAPLEQREFDAIHFGRLDLLPEIRAAQIPIKRRINAAEGQVMYPEAAEPEEQATPPFPHDVTHETMPDGSTHRFHRPIRCF